MFLDSNFFPRKPVSFLLGKVDIKNLDTVLGSMGLKLPIRNLKIWHKTYQSVVSISTINFVCLTVLEFELNASLMLGRHSTTWAMPQALFALVVFKKMVSHLCLGSRGLQSFYLCFLHRLDDRHIPPYSAFIGWDGRSHEFLPGMASNCSLPNVHIPSG
jgi:hypothetical protein